MDIINILTLQLTKIENLLKKDLENNSITYNYHINEKANFLNYYKLQSFITSNEIKNLEALTNINRKCKNILELWNLDLKDVPYKELKEDFNYINHEKEESLSTSLDFHTISTLETDDYWKNYNTIHGKRFFIENYGVLNYPISKIASMSINITNLIENQFPETIVSLSGEYYLYEYLTKKKFRLQTVIKALEKKDFDPFCKRIENYEFRYFFIAKNLEGKKQIEFKHDTLDHIKEVRDAQLISKYKVVLNGLIENITSDKEGIENEAEEKNNFILSTIDEHFEDVRNEINDDDYDRLRNALKTFIENEKFPTLEKEINLKRLAVKKVGWIINRILFDFGKSVSIDVLNFSINNISIYSKQEIDKTDYKKTNIYKHFTQKT